MNTKFTRGVVFIHSAPRALCPHIEWALGNLLETTVNLDWTEQSAQENTFRAEYSWIGKVGTGAALASALRGWEHLRYEITEDASPTVDGGRWSYTPDLGIFYAQTDAVGNVVVSEERILAALEHKDNPSIMLRELDLVLGRAWDDELEPFRYAGIGAPVKWLHRVS